MSDTSRDARLADYLLRAHDASMEPAPRSAIREDAAADSLQGFVETMQRRRSIRSYSTKPVPWELVEQSVRAAGRAPSGANQQPWTYVIVSDPHVKQQMRAAIEREELETYARRASDEWLDALAPLGTDWQKDHITTAPYIAVVFAQTYGIDGAGDDDRRKKHFYVMESVGISVGFFLAALTHAGLSTLTHTPNPMGVLATILGRPANERCFVVIPIGYASDDAVVPAITKKSLDDILVRV